MNDRLCEGCGLRLGDDMRADAKYHGEACRSRARHHPELAASRTFWARLQSIRRRTPERPDPAARPPVVRQSPVKHGDSAP